MKETPPMTTTNETCKKHELTAGDRVHAGRKMAGCSRQWWSGTGSIREILPPDPDNVYGCAQAVVVYDRPALSPCKDRDHDHEPSVGVVVPLDDDRVQSLTAAHFVVIDDGFRPEPCPVCGDLDCDRAGNLHGALDEDGEPIRPDDDPPNDTWWWL